MKPRHDRAKRHTLFRLLRPGVREGVDWEIRHHIEERIDRLVDEGWDPGAARREAERLFGTTERYRNELVALWTTNEGRRWIVELFDSLVQDLRYGIRGIRKNPGFALTLIATLALGIGATGAIFSVLDALLFRPLPYDRPQELVDVQLNLPGRDFAIPSLMADQVEPWTEGADFFEEAALWEGVAIVRTDGPAPDQLRALASSANLDEVLGIGFALGRGLVEEDMEPGARVVVLTWPYWTRTGSDPDVVGSDIRIDDTPWTVVGVLDRGVKYPVSGRMDVWIPLANDGTAAGRTVTQTAVVGRLADGVTVGMAQERADAMGAALADEIPHQLGWSTLLRPVDDWRGGDDPLIRGLWMTAAAVALMFLIAAVNAVNLLLVRAQARAAEVGVRKAMGASRRRLLRQVLVETVLLSLLSGIVATGVAWVAVVGIRFVAPRQITLGLVHELGLEGRALAMIFVVATVAGLLVGLLPGLRLARTRTQGAGTARGGTSDRSSSRLRSALVLAEVAISVVLLVGAGLFLRSFATIQRVDLGMDAERVAFAQVQLPSVRYATPADRAAFTNRVLERFRGLPGVSGVSLSAGVPPDGGWLAMAYGLEAEGETPREAVEMIPFTYADVAFFETLGTRFYDGRPFVEGDEERNAVVLDRDLARTVFGEERVAGRTFRLNADREWLTVVGVVEELKLGGPDDRSGAGMMAYPIDVDAPPTSLSFVVRTEGDPADLLQPIRLAVVEVDDLLPITSLETGEMAVAESLVRPRFIVVLLGVLAALALILAGVGLFGVLSYSMRQRQREMGIRMALGASTRHVQSDVLRWGLLVGGSGTALGLVGAFLVDDLAASLLFGVAPGDAITTVGVAATMLLVTLLACWLPARRTTRIDPVEVLRTE